MKAVILAGGEGKRLRPITCTRPKPMVPLLDKPTLFYTLELLKKHGVGEAVIALGYMGESIRQAVGSGEAFGLKVTYSDPGSKLGTAGSVREAVGNCSETVLVMSGDGVTDADITAAERAHAEKGAPVTVLLYKVADPGEYGIAITDPEGYIVKFIEKPSDGEIFSDRANTGIYLLEPSALSLIPEGKEFDFSNDLFPMLLGRGEKISGFELSGYWCDIGDPSELRRAQADMLEGRFAFASEMRKSEGAFISPDALISPEAVINGLCYIGKGAEIASRAVIGPYSVISEGAKVLEGASVKRSVIMNGAIIRSFAELRGTVVCENADVDSRSVLLEGSVIGAGSRLGRGAAVSQNVSVWPDKYIEPGTKCTRDVIWGENRRNENGGSGFSGYADREMTPEYALRIAAAFAAGARKPCDFGVGSDGSSASVMIKRALEAGVLSQGANAVSTEALSRSAFGYAVKTFGLSGGIYVSSDPFEKRIDLTLYSGSGTEAEPSNIRGVVKRMSSGDVKPVTSSEIGVARSLGSADLCYEAELLRISDAETLRENERKLIINAPEPLADSAARMLLKLGWTVDTVSELKKLIQTHNEDAISILVDKDEKTVCFTAETGRIGSDRILAAVAAGCGIKKAVLPAEFDDGLIAYLKEKGTEYLPGPEDPARRRSFACTKNAYDRRLLEPEAITIKLCELFCTGRLKEILSEMPPSSKKSSEIPASKCDFGPMLRSVIESDLERVESMTDGVKLRFDTGWVTVRPDSLRNALRVVGGSRDAEYAKELCDIYTEKLRKLKRTDNKS